MSDQIEMPFAEVPYPARKREHRATYAAIVALRKYLLPRGGKIFRARNRHVAIIVGGRPGETTRRLTYAEIRDLVRSLGLPLPTNIERKRFRAPRPKKENHHA